MLATALFQGTFVMPVLPAFFRRMQINAAAGFRWQAQSKLPLLSGQIGCLFFWAIFSVHHAEDAYARLSHIMPCPCFGRIRPKCVMRRGLRATFRRAENKDTGEKRDKRQEGMPAGDRKEIENSFDAEKGRTYVSRETFSIIFFRKMYPIRFQTHISFCILKK